MRRSGINYNVNPISLDVVGSGDYASYPPEMFDTKIGEDIGELDADECQYNDSDEIVATCS